MSQKPDYYEVLGVAKTASKADIKSAYQRIAMKNHPDMVKNKASLSDAEKAAAIEKFKLATEAEGVLSDDAKRATYDKFGHKGIENLAAGKSAGSGQTFADVAGPTQRRTYSTEDTFDFFEKRKAQGDRSSGAPDDGLTSEQRRERARQERMARRGRTDDAAPDTSSSAASAANAFHDVAEKLDNAGDSLRRANNDNVAVPLDALEKFRDSLAEILGEVDKAIAKAKPAGHRPRP